jgi:hypothetical protein
MNAQARNFSLSLRPMLAAVLALAPAAALAQMVPPNDVPMTQAEHGAEAPAKYPSFKDVPATPTKQPTVADWKAAVTALKGAGDGIAVLAANQPWTPNDNGAWAERDRQIATAPPPVDAPYDPAADAEAAQIRARAMAPSRTH